MSATVPPIIYVMHGCSAANPIRVRARPYIIYIIYREITTAIPRIKMLAVNIF